MHRFRALNAEMQLKRWRSALRHPSFLYNPAKLIPVILYNLAPVYIHLALWYGEYHILFIYQSYQTK